MSKIEVNQISSQCGSTLTIGQSGDTIQLACGATQTGFGRTGTVNWDTTAKTASFTAVSGTGYFVNTTSGAITVTLPATPSAGDIVSLADYTNTWQTNSVTVARNGSPIGGVNDNATLSIEGQSVTFVYVDGTEGWKNVQDSTSNVTGDIYITATGGTITTCGDYKIHTFTGPGTFCVSGISPNPPINTVDYLVVAGGGGGGWDTGGGGGAGGFRISSGAASGCYSVSPLGSCVSALPVSVTGYPIQVGAGGSCESGPNPTPPNPGSNSSFSTITSAGGGGGAPCASTGGNGGSAGGGARNSGLGGTGNTPPVSPPQGNNGRDGATVSVGGGGGGGGAGGIGGIGVPDGTTPAGFGGVGSYSNINPAAGVADGPVCGARYFAGGGGGGTRSVSCNNSVNNCGGAGGGGNGSKGASGGGPIAGTANTGGGAGGAGGSGTASAGGSGIVIIRYKYQ